MAKKQKPRAVQLTIFDIGGNPLSQELISDVEKAVVDVIHEKVTVGQDIKTEMTVE